MSVYKVTGMSCAACSQRVEKATMKVDGVESCAVSLLTNSMRVEGSASEADIINAVKKAGYGIIREDTDLVQNCDDISHKSIDVNSDEKIVANEDDKERTSLKFRLIFSIVLTIALMYISMGHMMWGFPLPTFFRDNHIGIGILEMLISIAVMVINNRFFINGFRGIIRRSTNMDTLVALGSSASFIYSLYALFMMSRAVTDGNNELVMKYMDEFYFESAATILTLITVGKTLEARSKGKTTDALKSLISMTPKSANIEENGVVKNVPVSKVKVGDVFVVKPGESIPVDGIVIDGASSVNESSLTGESVPAYKQLNDTVSQATLNQTGYIKCKATRVGADTTLSQIINLVKEASATKAPIAKLADKISGIFVPTVICIAIVTFIVWIIAGAQIGYALARAVSVLVISCPCALGLATPVAIMVGNGIGAKNGILFKNAISLEEAGKTQIVVLDKTGTITKGEPVVTDVVLNKCEELELLETAYSLEKKSEHPLAKAIIKYCEDKNITQIGTTNFNAVAGNGLKAEINGGIAYGGNFVYVDRFVDGHISDDMKNVAKKMSKEGKTPLYFAKEGKLLGIVAAMDVPKEDTLTGIKELKDMGISVVMATGDNKVTADAVARNVGITHVVAGVLPKDKNTLVNKLKTLGKVAMVGDGINDALALTSADTGIAIGTGTDVAIDAANVVLMKSSIKDVSMAIRMSRETLKNIKENLFWAFVYNVIGIPLAAGAWIPIFGWKLNPMFGAFAMGLSSFCVVSNALRLNMKNMKSTKHDKKRREMSEEAISTIIKEMEETNMTKTMKIEGMMCGHCEAAVKKALEGIEGVSEAVVSHESGTAIVTIEGEVSDEVLKKTVEDKDYKVLTIE